MKRGKYKFSLLSEYKRIIKHYRKTSYKGMPAIESKMIGYFQERQLDVIKKKLGKGINQYLR